jgi:hypothetical protein
MPPAAGSLGAELIPLVNRLQDIFCQVRRCCGDAHACPTHPGWSSARHVSALVPVCAVAQGHRRRARPRPYESTVEIRQRRRWGTPIPPHSHISLRFARRLGRRVAWWAEEDGMRLRAAGELHTGAAATVPRPMPPGVAFPRRPVPAGLWRSMRWLSGPAWRLTLLVHKQPLVHPLPLRCTHSRGARRRIRAQWTGAVSDARVEEEEAHA